MPWHDKGYASIYVALQSTGTELRADLHKTDSSFREDADSARPRRAPVSPLLKLRSTAYGFDLA